MCSQPTEIVKTSTARVDATISARVAPAAREAAARASVVGIEPMSASQASWASNPIETPPS